MIIEIEGTDGIGKTTQCRLLRGWFETRNQQSMIVKDLESTQLGRQVKAILTSDTPRTKEVELFGFLCCKAHLFSEIIGPKVKEGTHIICDRGIGSFLCYFEVLGFNADFLKRTVASVLPEKFASTTLLLDGDVHEAIRRNVAKPAHSKFDNMGLEFFEKQQRVYRRLATTNRWIVIGGNDPIEKVHQSITAAVVKL